jgi:5-formyltetrahydrofolate cyclo-ligase
MEFHYIQTFDEVETGYKGIQEPKKADRACEKQALVIMPTVGADTSCNRIGYGKGYYDTYLATHPEYQTLALAFDMQIVAYLPVERFDKKPQILITETKTYFAPL